LQKRTRENGGDAISLAVLKRATVTATGAAVLVDLETGDILAEAEPSQQASVGPSDGKEGRQRALPPELLRRVQQLTMASKTAAFDANFDLDRAASVKWNCRRYETREGVSVVFARSAASGPSGAIRFTGDPCAPETNDRNTREVAQVRARSCASKTMPASPAANATALNGKTPSPNGNRERSVTRRTVPTVDDARTLAQIAASIRGRSPEAALKPIAISAPDTEMQIGSATSEAAPTASDRLLVHELRTPIGAIQSVAEMLLSPAFADVDRTQFASYLADMRSSAAQALGVLERLGGQPKETGEPAPDRPTGSELNRLMALSFETLDLGPVVRAAAAASALEAQNRGIALVLKIGLSPAPWIRGDALALRQITTNLLTNALAHTPSGGTVTASCEWAADTSMPMIQLAVHDTGAGMTAAMVNAAIAAEPKADAMGRTRRPFGLRIVDTLARAHGGALAIDSAVGIGTRVTVHLPAINVAPSRS